MKARSIYKNDLSTDAITNDSTILYTVPPNTRAKWVLAFVKNSSGSTISGIDLEVVNDMSISILAAKTLTAGEFLQFDSTSGYLMLEEGYEIRGRAGDTGIDCVLTVEETSGIVRTN